MTIDEMINWVRRKMQESQGVHNSHNVIYRYSQILILLRELKWYREQDFIKRDNVKEKCRCTLYREEYCKNTTPCKECTEYGLFFDDIEKIPKAEYIGDEQ